jgi:hypothetical protein
VHLPNIPLTSQQYGEGATYDSIEGRFRKIKKDAEVLRKEISSGARPSAPERGTPKKPKAARNAVSTSNSFTTGSNLVNSPVEGYVVNGRVSKKTSPSKKRAVKTEHFNNASESGESFYNSNSNGSLGESPLGECEDGFEDIDTQGTNGTIGLNDVMLHSFTNGSVGYGEVSFADLESFADEQ